MPSSKSEDWIPVKVRYPKLGVPVQVTMIRDQKRFVANAVLGKNDYGDKIWFSFGVKLDSKFKLKKAQIVPQEFIRLAPRRGLVIAWKPYPQPYTGDNY